jgi:hypothetical protein
MTEKDVEMDEPVERSWTGLLAVLGAVVFTLTWVVLGFVSDGYQMWDIVVGSYSSIAQPISGLGLGGTAPAMNTAFVLCGALITIGTWTAMRRWPGADGRALRWARPMIAASGVGMAVCGLFDLESIMLHTLGFVLGVALPGVGFVVAGRALRGTAHHRLALGLLVAGPLTLAGVVGYLVTFDAEAAGRNEGIAGLVERVLLVVLMLALGAIGASTAGSGPGRGKILEDSMSGTGPAGRRTG